MLRSRRSQLGVASCCSEVRTVKVKDPCAYSVYAYVFDDGHTYIGLTSNLTRRASNHRNPKKAGAVQRYWVRSAQKSFPDMLVLYTGLSALEAQRTEGLLVDNIAQDLRLNVAPTGPGLGGLGGYLERSEEDTRESKELQKKKTIARMTEWVRAHPEERKRYMKMYRQRNKELLRSKDKAYHFRFRQERLAKKAEYTRTHKDKKREYDRIYRQSHQEKRKEQMKAWRKKKELETTPRSGR